MTLGAYVLGIVVVLYGCAVIILRSRIAANWMKLRHPLLRPRDEKPERTIVLAAIGIIACGLLILLGFVPVSSGASHAVR